MLLKDLRPLMVQTFCVIVTMVVAGKFVMDTFFPAFGVRDLREGDIEQMLLMGLVGSLSFLVFYSKKELSRQKMLVRVLIHLALTTPVLWFLYWKWEWLPIDTPKGAIAATIVCIISYIALFGGIFLKEINEANKMNDALKKKREAKKEG